MGHLPASHDNHVETRLRLVVPKNLASQALCSVSDDRATNFSGGSNAEPGYVSVV
jgi:hypothetical protein